MTRIAVLSLLLLLAFLATRLRPKAPIVHVMPHVGPISQEDVDDWYGGMVPEGRWVLGPNWAPGV
jgi:hypothetical protein